MGMYDTVLLESEVELPEFPDDISPSEIKWQTKSLRNLMNTYIITDNGELLIKKKEKREMTDKELDEYAEEQGFDSWDDWERSDTPLNEPLESWKYTIENEWWEDTKRHGSFKFYSYIKDKENIEDSRWLYEARFTDGLLDEIILINKNEIEK